MSRNEQAIAYIDINKLHPHPKNPRRELGDLSELAGSIMSRGVMQNLTIVPHPGKPGEYMIVIGHRRHAAARIAELTELPCVVSDMDEKEQVSTMLLENMQRSDLTLDEQAQGFQMMLDLGDTVKDIAQKTGFSQKTVKQRLDLAVLDPEALRESHARGGTIEDYVKLGKIDDIKKRNELLNVIGTSEFNWKYNQAQSAQEQLKYKPGIIQTAKTFAVQMKNVNDRYGSKYIECQRVRYEKGAELKIPADAGNAGYKWFDAGTYVEIYKKAEKKVPEKTEAQIEDERRKKALKEGFRMAFELRMSFVKSFAPAKVANAYRIIDDMAAEALFRRDYLDEDNFRRFYGIEEEFRYRYEKGDGETYGDAVKRIIETGQSAVPPLLAAAYLAFEGHNIRICYNYYNRYEPDETLLSLYGHLGNLGYTTSSEERKLLDGTHEDYAPPKQNRELEEHDKL